MNKLFNKVLDENEKMCLLFLLKEQRNFWPTQCIKQKIDMVHSDI